MNKTSVKLEKILLPSANFGPLNPMPDIKNISYIHARQECTGAVSDEEKKYINKGMLSTLIPYKIQDDYDRCRDLKEFTIIVLENEKIRAEFMPETGARLRRIYDKTNNKELLYVNPVFQPGNLALRNAWFSGGVEFNVGIKGHNPLTCSPMWCSVVQTTDGEVVRFYEYERIRGVVYSINAYLPENSSVLYVNCKIENCRDEQIYMYWWSNIAFPETDNVRVIVPAKEAFVCAYKENRYLLDKCAIPYYNDTDVSYPKKINISRDFFYKISPENHKWIAASDKDGYGLIHASDDKLIGRKLFVWGQGQGGKNWNEWLSVKGSAYIEIQAGLAHTQLEHIPMPAKTTWEWTEAYMPLRSDAKDIHSSYDDAVKAVENAMYAQIGNPNTIAFPALDPVEKSEIICKGSSWGYLEEMLRKEKISKSLAFENTDSDETNGWLQLLRDGTFEVPNTNEEPKSYVAGQKWLARLKGLKEQSWYSMLHIGVIKYADGDAEGAHKAWADSIRLKENPWAIRNIAMLYKNEYGDLDKATELILRAFELKRDCRALCAETANILTDNKKDELWLSLFESLDKNLQAVARLQLYKAVAFVHIGKIKEAAQIINKDFIMSDIKEGELSLSHIWYVIYRKLYALGNNIPYEPNNREFTDKADKKYPLPKELDFRMHGHAEK